MWKGMGDARNFSELLYFRASVQPDQVLYRYLGDGENETAAMTYGELDEKARGIAAALFHVCRPGDRALLVYLPDLDYIAGFMGCLYAGVIAVPAYPPDPSRPAQTLPKLKAIARDADIAVVLSTNAILSAAKTLFDNEPEWKKIKWLTTDDLPSLSPSQWPLADIHREDLAFLQYTSGSTGAPKGVMVSHGNLLENAALIQAGFEDTDQTFGVSWLPPYHDMGLIGGILQPIYLGAATVLMSPLMFLQKPFRWLAAISKYRATTNGGPNFAYDLCVRKVSAEEKSRLDLSCWQVAYNGAEPIRHETLVRFVEAFGPCGFKKEAFYPCYGMAEATLFVSGGRRTDPPVSISVNSNALIYHRIQKHFASDDQKIFVSCGRAMGAEKIIIVDPETQVVCPDGVVGEIWITGPNVAKGYWNKPEETEEKFRAYLADTGQGPFLRTGDLGFIDRNELYITGRIKDMIIIRGLNHYPQDIETSAEKSHPDIRPGCGAAFSIHADGEEQVVLVYEVKQENISNATADEIIRHIRQAVSASESISLHAVWLLKPKTIPKTSSGKIQRYACREGFLKNTLSVVAKWDVAHTDQLHPLAPPLQDMPGPDLLDTNDLSAHAIEKWLIHRFAQRLRILPSEVNPRLPFSRYGLDSAEAVGLAGELETWMGKRLPPTLLYDHPSIQALAGHLAGKALPKKSYREASRRMDDPSRSIAVIGMGCRFPGADTPEAFWQLIMGQVNAITEVPEDRWPKDAFYSQKRGTPGKMNTKWGGFLSRIDQFDPQFFGISPREAAHMDPQQRLLLEVTWEALENAGIPMEKIDNTATGVFIGISGSDYSRIHFHTPASMDAYAGPGNALCIAANRISYWLNLHGPSWAVDTACSSSLVAIHQACQSLRAGECDAAIAGGANMILTPQITVSFSQAGMMSSEGKCKSFDADADGYVRSEGAGVVILKRLSDAIKDGNEVLAVIRGTGVNQDGRSSSMTAPNGPAQQNVILNALADAGMEPSEITYVEAHGTGTPIGDPIELGSLKNVLTQDRSSDNFCWIGSVKSNIGHLEAASGIAGLIKVVMSLRNGVIPPNIHYRTPTPHVPLAGTPLAVPTRPIPWPNSKRRVAGISSFGFGGTNAHLVVEEAPIRPSGRKVLDRTHHALTLSAKNESALKELAMQYADFFSQHPDLRAADVCCTANTSRSHFSYRMAVTASHMADLVQKLKLYASGESPTGVCVGKADPGAIPSVAFLFTGQGAQYPGMARTLFETQPVFRKAMEECQDVACNHLSRPLLDVIFDSDPIRSPINRTEFTQPALFAMEYSLAKLWQSWGIQPVAVLGHSVGEYVAACIAGVFSLKDGLTLIVHRGRLMQSLPENGAMAAVLCDLDTLTPLLESYPDINIAAFNGKDNIVLSGEKTCMEKILSELSGASIPSKKLVVSHAFHSKLMEPMADRFLEAARSVCFSAPQLPLISNLTGEKADASIADPRYWRCHALSPVRFFQSIKTLYNTGVRIFLECGPDPVLSGMGKRCIPDNETIWLPSLRRGKPDWLQMLMSLTELYVRGAPVLWDQVDFPYAARRVRLPNYPFQRKRYWIQPHQTLTSAPLTGAASSRIGHPLIGTSIYPAVLKKGEKLFESVVRTGFPEFLNDHQIFNHVIFPAAGYVEMAIASASAALEAEAFELENVLFHRPLLLDENTPRRMQVFLSPRTSGYEFKIFSTPVDETGAAPHDSSWTLHASGAIDAAKPWDQERRPLCFENETSDFEISGDRFYAQLKKQGFNYGMTFRGIEKLWRRNGNAWGKISLPSTNLSAENYIFPPWLLDACFHTLAGVVNGKAKDVYLPVGIERMAVRPVKNNRLWCRTGSLAESGSGHRLKADLDILDADGRWVARVTGFTIQQTKPEMFGGRLSKPLSDSLYHLMWEPNELSENPHPGDRIPGVWIVFADQKGLGKSLSLRMASSGDRVVWVGAGDRYARHANNQYRISPESPDDFHEFFKDLKELSLPCKGIVYLWSLDTPQNVTQAMGASPVLGCHILLYLIQALASTGWRETPRLWVVTRMSKRVLGQEKTIHAASAPLWGLGRVIALEYPSLRCTCVDLDSESSEEIHLMADTLLSADPEDQIAFRNGKRYVARLKPYKDLSENHKKMLKIPESESYRLAISGYGLLENLYLSPAERLSPGPDEVEIEVMAAGLNFRDVLNALGMLEKVSRELGIASAAGLPFGGECAGVVVSVGEHVKRFRPGEPVIAAFAVGSLGRYVCVPQDFVIKKPEILNFEQAVTLPIAFLTAWYGLIHLAKLQPGDKILIHAAAGGVGQAAVQLAKWIGAEVFATASPAKWAFLKSMGIFHVMNSRDLDFARQILDITHGAGVDVVFNSLNGDFIQQSLSVLAPGGRFVEIGKIGIWDHEQMKKRRPDVSYLPFDLMEVAGRSPDLMQNLLLDIIGAVLENKIGPLSYKSFSIQESVSAFRYMAQAKHIGKVVIVLSPPHQIADKVLIRSDATYLITGGFGALGLRAAKWLAEKGARHLVLVGRRVPSGATQKTIEQISESGVKIMTSVADVSQWDEMARLMRSIEPTFPAIKGIIHAAGVLADGMLGNLSRASFEAVMAPKVAGAWNLHLLTQDRHLDFFALFSSAASLIGSPGQGNYAAANAFLDGLAQYRCSQGLPALSINWGPWSGGGMAEKTTSAKPLNAVFAGMDMIDPDEGFEVFEDLLHNSMPQMGVLPIHWQAFLQRFAGNILPPVFEHFAQQMDATASEIPPVLQQLSDLCPDGRMDWLSRHLISQVSRVLGLSSDANINPRQPLKELGLDSLMAVELNNMIQKDIIIGLSAERFMENPSIMDLSASLIDILEAKGYLKGKNFSKTPVDAPEIPTPSPSSSNGWIAYRTPKPNASLNLFCFHHMGGSAVLFRGWGQDLHERIDVFPIQLPGREGRRGEPPVKDFDALIALLTDVMGVHLNRPFALFGHSMGAWIAFELAHAVQRQYGKTPEQLLVAAMPAPSSHENLLKAFSVDDAWLALMEIPHALKNDQNFMNEWRLLFAADLALFHQYQYTQKPLLNCPITAFGGIQDSLVTEAALSQWRRHTAADFQLKFIRGGHMFPVENKHHLLELIEKELLCVHRGEYAAHPEITQRDMVCRRHLTESA